METVIGHTSLSGYVQPIGSSVGLAGVNVHHVLAVLALDSAAPLEFALALGDAFHAHGVVAPPTAHDLTAVCPSGGLVTHSACCAQRTCKERKRVTPPYIWRANIQCENLHCHIHI